MPQIGALYGSQCRDKVTHGGTSRAVNFPVIKSGGVPWIFSLMLQIFFPSISACYSSVSAFSARLPFFCSCPCATYCSTVSLLCILFPSTPLTLFKCHSSEQILYVMLLRAANPALLYCFFSSLVVSCVQRCGLWILHWREPFTSPSLLFFCFLCFSVNGLWVDAAQKYKQLKPLSKEMCTENTVRMIQLLVCQLIYI